MEMNIDKIKKVKKSMMTQKEMHSNSMMDEGSVGASHEGVAKHIQGKNKVKKNKKMKKSVMYKRY